MSQIVPIDQMFAVQMQGFESQRMAHEALTTQAAQLNHEIEKVRAESLEIESRIHRRESSVQEELLPLLEEISLISKQALETLDEKERLIDQGQEVWKELKKVISLWKQAEEAKPPRCSFSIADIVCQVLSKKTGWDLTSDVPCTLLKNALGVENGIYCPL